MQDYVERLTRQRVAEMPDGTWETEDYIDYDPSKGEGLIPIKVKMTIDGDQLSLRPDGLAPGVGTFLNAGFGSAFSGVIAGTKTFFPDVPLNSGFYRVVEVDLGPVGHGRQRAMADRRDRLLLRALREDHELDLRAVVAGSRPSGRSPARSTSSTCSSAAATRAPRNRPSSCGTTGWSAAGVGATARTARTRPPRSSASAWPSSRLEGQERLSPVLTTGHEIATDSGGPGKFRGGCGVEKGGDPDARRARTVMSYCCDRARSITWGIEGGLPSIPHGVWLTRAGGSEFLGAVFSNVPVGEGDDSPVRRPVGAASATRSSATRRP